MRNLPRQDLKLIAHPYLFVLKEGKSISANPLDFSLLMLRVSTVETIKGVGRVKNPELKKDF